MEGLSVAASGIAVVSLAFQLTEACNKLYKFWESVEDAPQEITGVKEDLHYLSSVFEGLGCNGIPLGYSVMEGIQHCRLKVAELTSIVEKFDVCFQSSSRRKRVWAAFKAATHSKQIQRFRESLSETKSTLTLAMIHQCVLQPQYSSITASTNVYRNLRYRSIDTMNHLQSSISSGYEGLPAYEQLQAAPSARRKPAFRSDFPLPSNDGNSVLTCFDEVLPEPSIGKIQELMLHAIGQTTTATFETTSTEIFAQDAYTMDENGIFRSKTFVYSKNLRYRTCHQASRFKVALGCVWVRTTTIYVNDRSHGLREKSQSVTSVVFYPTRWIQRLGVKNGLEAIMATDSKSWMLNCRLTLTRAVPEDSLIFELCRNGQTSAVETLLSKGIGSVVDTSPKGWKPLHFAAAGGHVDLCAMLIREGADKAALVYEGPTPSILSPISLFVASAADLHAEVKISMLRLFSDCIDLGDPNDDGWTVHEWLKRAYARERVPISRNSITWLLHLKAKEEYVVFGARNVWCALQHALRSILGREQHGKFLDRILELSVDNIQATSRSHVTAIGFWLALRCSGREILPMAVNAGSFLQMKGFDWDEDDITHNQFLKALPDLYSAWCYSLLDCVEKVGEYMRLEWEICEKKLGWERKTLLDAISRSNTVPERSDQKQSRKKFCTHCNDDYSALGYGLVEPARIAITECLRTDHKFKCTCWNIHTKDIDAIDPSAPVYAQVYHEEDSDTDEEFFDAESYLTDELIINMRDPRQHSYLAESSDIFLETATMLYRSHGRVWMGEYDLGEYLCATCLLRREQYIGEDGLGTDFPPMPESFEGLRVKRQLKGAFDVESD